MAFCFWANSGFGWIPYTLRPDHARAERYKALFGKTHAFLKERNGIRPNTCDSACRDLLDPGLPGLADVDAVIPGGFYRRSICRLLQGFDRNARGERASQAS